MDQLKFNISLYETFPNTVEDLTELIEMTLNRLELYQILKQNPKISCEDLKIKLGNSPLKYLLTIEDTLEVKQARYRDCVSHFILRAMYCEQYPEFFIKMEITWLKLRYNSMSSDQKRAFLQTFTLTEATDDEKLKFSLVGKWYKMDWMEICELLSRRLYPVYLGYIYVPQHKMIFFVEQKLKEHLLSSLKHCKKMVDSLSDQFKLILDGCEMIKPFDYENLGELALEDLEEKSKHFPLCMKIQHENLKKNHHLKHFSRVQYGLFLKGLGLSLEDALEMWKEEFTKKMTEERFEKEYSYFFKHQYGVVGSKIHYSAEGCERIMQKSIGLGQIHGCPFKYWDDASLLLELQREKLSERESNGILSAKSAGKCQKACTRFLKYSRKCEIDQIIDHPIVYYQKSCEVRDIEDLVPF